MFVVVWGFWGCVFLLLLLFEYLFVCCLIVFGVFFGGVIGVCVCVCVFFCFMLVLLVFNISRDDGCVVIGRKEGRKCFI